MTEQVGLNTDESSLCDSYEHEDGDLAYTAVNIPGPGADSDDFNSQFEKGCDCTTGNCSTDVCQCFSQYGLNYTADGRLVDGKCDGPIMECHSECRCNRERGLITSADLEIESCRNRLVQYGPQKGLELFTPDKSKGFGLKSKNLISKGSFICEYAGEVISLNEARKRSENTNQTMNYIFVLKEHIGDSKIIKTCIDPSKIGNIGRYINHSCQPNSAIVPVRVDNPVPKLGIFSIRDIGIGEEITFDYGGGNADSTDENVGKRKRCFCGARNCRVFLPYDVDLL